MEATSATWKATSFGVPPEPTVPTNLWRRLIIIEPLLALSMSLRDLTKGTETTQNKSVFELLKTKKPVDGTLAMKLVAMFVADLMSEKDLPSFIVISAM